MPPPTNPLRRLGILFGVTVLAIAAIGGGVYIHHRITPQHRILIDNAHEFVVDVEVDGDRFTIGPRSSTSVAVHDGAHTIHTSQLNETITLDLPATGWSTAGRTALYNIGGRGELAIVTMVYGSVFDAPPTAFIGHEAKAVVLPLGVGGEIDEAFPAQVTSKRGGAVIRRVCHVDGERFKCPGSHG